MHSNIVEIFYLADEPRRARRSQFCKEFDRIKSGHILKKDNGKRYRNRQFTMSDSEAITIMICFHISGYRYLKGFYINHIQKHCQSDFPKTVSCNRFVELQQKALVPMTLFLHTKPLSRYFCIFTKKAMKKNANMPLIFADISTVKYPSINACFNPALKIEK